MTLQESRLHLYTICFAVAFLLYLAMNGRSQNLFFWAMAGLSFAGVILGSFGRHRRAKSSLRFGVMAGTGLAVCVPLIGNALNGEPLAATIRGNFVWPQLLVTLIASRVLFEEAQQRFVQFWQQPLEAPLSVESQSIGSAFSLGAFLTIAFYLFVPASGASKSDPALSIVLAAFSGTTFIHHLIIFLFFVIAAALIDAAYLHMKDRRALERIRRAWVHDFAPAGQSFRACLADMQADAAPRKSLRLLQDAIDRADGTLPQSMSSTFASLNGFQLASRRFIRAQLPLLPLLGFLGTVIGLATAMAELPRGFDPDSGHGLDFSGAFGGLALKFQTTLLGLIASMIATMALNTLEKREAELAAECTLIAEAAAKKALI